MLPTIGLTGNLLLAERLSTRLGLVGPGDIVLIRSPQNPRMVTTKRLIGLEGDSVTYVVDPAKSDRCETIVVRYIHIQCLHFFRLFWIWVLWFYLHCVIWF